jgi:hypothetical protein
MSASLLRPLLRSPPLARAFQARSFAAQSAQMLAPAAATPAARKALVAPSKQAKPEPAAGQKMPSRVMLATSIGSEIRSIIR